MPYVFIFAGCILLQLEVNQVLQPGADLGRGARGPVPPLQNFFVAMLTVLVTA